MSKYFDPILQHNNEEKRYKGYCTDIFTDAAIQFIEKNCNMPFFVYLSTNTPHVPLQIGEEYVSPYRVMGLEEMVAKLYGMVTNIDDNVGLLLDKLKELNIENNTIVIFMTDNGPSTRRGQPERYNAELRGSKLTVYEGGIRVPFFIRWPDMFNAEKKIDRIAAHIDVLPTLLGACNIIKPDRLSLDGLSLMPLLLGENVDWYDRTLYFQWHSENIKPQLYRNCAAVSQRYKLVQPQGNVFQPGGSEPDRFLVHPIFELYDLEADPYEKKNIAAEYPDVVARMRKGYENWFHDLSLNRGFVPPRIQLGTPFENPVILNREGWRGEGWSERDIGYWEVRVVQANKYTITLQFPPTETSGEAHFKLDGVHLSKSLERGTSLCSFDSVTLKKKDAQLEAWLRLQGKSVGVSSVYVEHLL